MHHQKLHLKNYFNICTVLRIIIHFHILLGNQSIGCLGSHVNIFRNNILPYCCGIFFILDGTIGYRL